MALHNEILVGRFNRFAQHLFGLKGGPPAPQLSSEIQISHPIFHGKENRFLESWTTWGSSTSAPATIGQTDGVQLRNPLTSNVVAVVEKITVASNGAAAGTYQLSTGAQVADFAGAVPSQTLDGRYGNVSNPVSIVTFAVNSPSSLGIIQNLRILTNVMYEVIVHEDQQLTVLPGFAVRIISGVANQELNVCFWWRERALEEGELK